MPVPFGMYLINPGKRKKSSRKKSFTSKNPMKTKRRRRSFSRKNPSMKRRTRRGRFTKRNPASRRRRSSAIMVFPNSMKRKRRRSFSARNPVRRRGRRSFIRRNPASGIGSTIFDRDTMIVAGGVVIGTVGTNLVLNKLLLPNAAGAVPFKLPGVNFQQSNYMNSIPVALYKFGIGAAAGYLLRNTSPRLAQGIVVGAFAGGISSILQSTNALGGLQSANVPATIVTTAAPGVSRFFRGARGAGAYVPGVPSIYTGPASGFLNKGSPMGRKFGMRRGAGAMFNRTNARRATNKIANPFLA